MATTKFTPVDMSGKTFGFLTAIKIVGRSTGKAAFAMWLFKCVCGKDHIAAGSNVRRGHVQSCGCERYKTIGRKKTTHGHTKGGRNSPTMMSYDSMRARCEYPKDKEYWRYGGAGVTVCERWKKFENFLADMGLRPEGKTLDRYPDNNGNYEPGNCRWATHYEQVHNRRVKKDHDSPLPVDK